VTIRESGYTLCSYENVHFADNEAKLQNYCRTKLCTLLMKKSALLIMKTIVE